MFKTLLLVILSSYTLSSSIEIFNTKISKYIDDIKPFQQMIEEDSLHIYSSYQREEILRASLDFLKESGVIDQNNILIHRKKIKFLSHNNYQYIKTNLLSTLSSSELILKSFEVGTPLVAVLSEDNIKLNYQGNTLKKILTEVLKQARTGWPQVSSDKHYRNKLDLTAYDISKLSIIELKEVFKIDEYQARSINQYADKFLSNVVKILDMKEGVDTKVGTYTPLYHLKVMLLKAASFISLPVRHNIDYKMLRDTYTLQMEPGDIGVIQRFYKLSNLVFKGDWTHSLLYIGRYTQLKNFVESDLETNIYYKNKCILEKIDCINFMSYLATTYPESFLRYMKSDYDDDPLVSIEALKPGVILNRIKNSMAWDNLAVLRPNLSILDRAMAIDRAFSLIGLKYDYNFNGYTNGKLVCTEVIKYAYEEDIIADKKGLGFKMSFALGSPIMYAFDLVKTYFSELNNENKYLQFVLYLKSSKGDKRSYLATEEDLLDSIDMSTK